jgi:hypothetical protein
MANHTLSDIESWKISTWMWVYPPAQASLADERSGLKSWSLGWRVPYARPSVGNVSKSTVGDVGWSPQSPPVMRSDAPSSSDAAKILYMCQSWAAVHKFKLEVKSNLKISTLNLKLDSSDCNKSMRGIQAVAFSWTTVPTDRPAHWRWRGRRRWSTWKLAPPFRAIPPCSCHDIGEHIMKSVISHGYDIRSYWYQRALLWLMCSDVMSHIISLT